MTVVPFALPPDARVLVAGAGGGFDFLCGLPLALELEGREHQVHLASYSFTRLQDVQGARRHGPNLLEVGADATLDGDPYFPERDLALWYRERLGAERSVWCLGCEAVPATRDAYRELVDRLGIDVVFCVDGGVDGLFRGDEADLATSTMDSVSVIAASLSGARGKYYVCTAFGVEGAETGTVSHAHALERMSELAAKNAMRGVGTVLKRSSVGKYFLDAASFIDSRLPDVRRSIVVSSIAAAMRGAHGRTSVTEKTRERPPWLSALTPLYWYFEAKAVARSKLFYADVKELETLQQVGDAIEECRRQNGVKPFEPIPI